VQATVKTELGANLKQLQKKVEKNEEDYKAYKVSAELEAGELKKGMELTLEKQEDTIAKVRRRSPSSTAGLCGSRLFGAVRRRMMVVRTLGVAVGGSKSHCIVCVAG
jgi:hypothetical protein